MTAVVDPQQLRQMQIVSGGMLGGAFLPYAILEGAALFCAIGLIAGANQWPLLAAAVPIGAMIVRFPRGA